MPANIQVTSSAGNKTTHWIEDYVVRIGSDPDADICIPSPELAGRAATLEFRNGNYIVHNRTSVPISLGSDQIQPAATAPWKAGQNLTLPGSICLRLEIQGDPAPVPHRASSREILDESSPAPPADPAPDGSGKKAVRDSTAIMQIAVIIACVVGMAGMLYVKFRGGGAPSVDSAPSLEKVMDLLAAPKTKELAQQIQEAEVLVRRGDVVDAFRRFGLIRDALISGNYQSGGQSTVVDPQVRAYVKSRLEQIEALQPQ